MRPRYEIGYPACLLIIPAVFLLLCPAGVQANRVGGPTWYVATDGDDTTGDGSVGDPFATIQFAIDAAAEGDTVLIHDGRYTGDGNRDIEFRGKALLVASLGGDPEQCVIDCEGSEVEPHRGFWFHAGEDTTSTLRGLRITGGFADDAGGGVLISETESDEWSSPKLENCWIDSCTAEFGAGIAIQEDDYDQHWGSRAVVRACRIEHNIGNGIQCNDSGDHKILNSCVIADNVGYGFYFYHAAAQGHSSFEMINCDIVGNGGAGVYAASYNTGGNRLIDCRITDNDGWGAVFPSCEVYGPGTNRCEIMRNGEGGILVRSEGAGVSNTIIGENSGPGVYLAGCGYIVTFTGCTIRDNVGDGITVDNVLLLTIRHCLSKNNDGYGFHKIENSGDMDVYIYDSVFEGNEFGGVFVEVSDNWNFVRCERNTVVGNNGPGLFLGAPDGDIGVSNTLVANNTGAGFDLVDLVYAQIDCNDSYGNTAGNWVNAAAPLEGLDGNFSADPLFCSIADADYHLFDTSPCAPGNHPDGDDCGLIGALPVNCYIAPAPVPAAETRLLGNHPNPFNPATTIVYTLAHDEQVDLRLYDLAGRQVAILVAGEAQPPGRHQVTWRGRDAFGRQVAAGTYFCRLVTAAGAETRKLVLVK